jgi:hypothetical protein
MRRILLGLLLASLVAASVDGQVRGRRKRGVAPTGVGGATCGSVSPLTSQLIGTVGITGQACLDSGIYTLSGSGGYSALADNMRVIGDHTNKITDDGVITIHVREISGFAFAQAGVMLRETLDPDSKAVMSMMSAPGNSSLNLKRSRATTGGSSTDESAMTYSQMWLRVSRVNDVFTAYNSPDGLTWTQIGTADTIVMSSVIYAEFFVIGTDNSVLVTASFDNYSIDDSEGAGPPPFDGEGYRPGYIGYASDTVGGRAGSVCAVTSTSGTSTAVGSFRYCLNLSGARTVVFNTSGMIDGVSGGPFEILNPYITIAGQTAPSPGIAIKGELWIETHDVVVQHIRIRGGGSGDTIALWVLNDADKVAIDHVSVSYGAWDNIAMSSTNALSDPKDALFYEIANYYALACRRPAGVTNNPCHADSYPANAEFSNSRGMGIGDGWGLSGRRLPRITYMRSLDAHINDRHPEISAGTRSTIFNNVFYNPSQVPLGTIFFEQEVTGKGPLLSIVAGNILIPGPTTPGYLGYVDQDYGTSEGSVKLVRLYPNNWNTSSKIYLTGNYYSVDCGGTACLASPTAQWALANNPVGSSVIATTPPFTLANLDLNSILAYSAVEAYVQSHAGARPTNRDCLDTAVFASLTARTGSVPEDPTDKAGGCNDANGYPTLAVNTSTYTDPATPTAVDTGHTGFSNGVRTKREYYLETLALALEGW